MKTIKQRFDEKWEPVPECGCWVWTARESWDGYGLVNMGSDRRRIRAHRAAYELYVGPVPAGLWVLHKCDTRLCVNPDHLYLGTNHDNLLDMSHRQLTHRVKRELPPCVHFDPRPRSGPRPFWARIKRNGRGVYLGSYTNPFDAAVAVEAFKRAERRALEGAGEEAPDAG